jgi:prepilin-type N-terminal cleavage/methylation domain-containing protein
MFNFLKNKSKTGFTLFELLIVIALVVLIMALAFPIGIDFFQEQRVEEETATLADNIKIAQARAMAGQNDSAWGIRFNAPEQGQYTLFQGDSFDDPGRDTTYDEVFYMSSGAETGGATEIVFEKLTGKLIIS